MKSFLVVVLLPCLLFSAQGRPESEVEERQEGGCDCGNKIQGSANSPTAIYGEFPWRVRFCKDDASYNCCSGTIISPRWIVTSAWCVDPKKPEMKITISGSGKTITSEMVYRHNDYKPNEVDTDNDIGLIELPEKLAFTANVSAICLPYKYKRDMDFKGEVEFSGSGLISNGNNAPYLKKATLNLLENGKCQKINKEDFGRDRFSRDRQICTAPSARGPCKGDAGGSIDYISGNSWYLLGVTSNWGDSCANSSSVGIFARMTFFINDGWFQRHTEREKFCKE